MLTTLRYWKKIYWWIFPPTCILCHHYADRAQDLCAGCSENLPILPQSCGCCANTFAEIAISNLICGRCLTESPPFEATYALYYYHPPITKLIMSLKFHEQLINARILGENMAYALKHTWYANKPLPDMIIPVPLHPKRLQERGFNQAVEIARPIAALLKLPINTTGCMRVKHTAAQARLSADERAKNIKQAFRIEEDFTNRYVAVLDDVITTGQTITALCQALKTAGARRVDVWCCAKATLDHT